MHLIPLIITTAMAHAEPLPISIPINAVRASHDVPQLASTLELDCAARRHARDMHQAGLCRLRGTDNSTMKTRAESCGTEAHGELIACGFTDPEKAVKYLMRDREAQRIILNPDHIAMGTAHVGKTFVITFRTNFEE